jgi:hypothetical protein
VVTRSRSWVLGVAAQPLLSVALGLIAVASLEAMVVAWFCSAQVAFVFDQLAGLESTEEQPAHSETGATAGIVGRQRLARARYWQTRPWSVCQQA